MSAQSLRGNGSEEINIQILENLRSQVEIGFLTRGTQRDENIDSAYSALKKEATISYDTANFGYRSLHRIARVATLLGKRKT